MGTSISRRSFLTGAGSVAALVASAGLSGCAPKKRDTSESETTSVASSESSWLGSAPTIDKSSITDVLSCEVLVVGCGTSGNFAACSAAEHGANVIAIEKGGRGAGVRGTIGAIGTKWQIANGTNIKATDICHDIERYSASAVNSRLTNLWASQSAETVEWYGDLNIAAGRDFVICSDNDLSAEEQSGYYRHWATGHAVVQDGKTMEDDTVINAYAVKKGVDFHYFTKMVELVKENDRVTGIIAQDENRNYIQINASKGVIVCTGGYAHNQDMLSTLQPDTMQIFSYNSGLPNAQGDGIRACIWAGSDFDATHTSMLFDRCPLGPNQVAGKDMTQGMFWMGSQPWLKVNLAGERFADESTPYDFILHASSKQPDHTYCTIYDSNYEQYVYQFKTQGCSRMFPFENGAPVSAMTLDVVKGINAQLLEKGILQQADTIEELGQKLNIPPDKFAETVKHYNQLVASGTDTDFGKESFRLSPVDKPPYFGIRQTGYLLCTMDGVPINEDMNALDPDGNPIKGLYVCGNDSGSFFSHSYPDLVPGLACGRSATFGRRAGRIAASM